MKSPFLFQTHVKLHATQGGAAAVFALFAHAANRGGLIFVFRHAKPKKQVVSVRQYILVVFEDPVALLPMGDKRHAVAILLQFKAVIVAALFKISPASPFTEWVFMV